MLQIHFVQHRFGMSDPSMEEALYDVQLYRDFVGPAEQMLALVNQLLSEKGLMLKAGSAVDDAKLIPGPRSTKNGAGIRDPEMQSTQSSSVSI